jgi:hypothetical protein
VNRRTLVPVAAVAIAAAAGWATWAAAGGDAGADPAASSIPTATATIERRDLVQHETVDGTLGYGDAETLYAQAAGTPTRLRKPGTVVERGEPLYWLDGKPIVLMYGETAMWRSLDASSKDGRDIRDLEWNLVALGRDPDRDVEIDGDWDWATTAAVKRWQDDLGLEKTGAVELGRIAFLAGARRIGQLRTTRGASLQPGAEVLETTATTRVVTVDLDADKQSLVEEGDPAVVELSDGRSLEGTIADVGTVAEAQTDPQTGEQADATIPVEIRLARGAETGGLDETPVDVSLEKERAENALTVPVSALLALAEGGFGVEVVDADGSTRLVPVEPGMYADAIMEIRGAGIEEGMNVAVPE